MDDQISCAICGKQMSYINNRHLASHSITAAEYTTLYPNSPLRAASVVAKQVSNGKRVNAGRAGKPRSAEDLAAIRAGVAKRPSRKGISLGPKSDEQKAAQSEIMKALHKERPHWNLGKTVSDQTRAKIAESLKGRVVPPEVTAKVMATKKERGFDFAFFKGKKHSEHSKALISAKNTARYAGAREQTRSVMLPRIAEAGLELLNSVTDDVFRLRCGECGHEFQRNPQMFQPSKFKLSICDQCFPASKMSGAEAEVRAFIAGLLPTDERIIASDLEAIAPLELDIFVPSRGIAIEYCGLYWHSEIGGAKHRFYHQFKHRNCRDKGIRLITIFEDEWLNKRAIVESMLRNAFKRNNLAINARDCEVVELDAAEANQFLNESHIQGRGRSSLKLGLRKDGELVSVMTFMKGEISRRQTGWEINRFASKPGVTVRGAAGRLFKAFLRQTDPDVVTSYADLRYGSGEVYGVLTFEHVGETVPNYWYFRPGRMERTHRFALRKTEADPKDLTEWQARQAQGWDRIWDCGHAKWVWTKS